MTGKEIIEKLIACVDCVYDEYEGKEIIKSKDQAEEIYDFLNTLYSNYAFKEQLGFSDTNTKPIDPEISKVVVEMFWDLV